MINLINSLVKPYRSPEVLPPSFFTENPKTPIGTVAAIGLCGILMIHTAYSFIVQNEQIKEQNEQIKEQNERIEKLERIVTRAISSINTHMDQSKIQLINLNSTLKLIKAEKHLIETKNITPTNLYKGDSPINLKDPRINLVEKGRNNQLPPVVGRDAEIEQLMIALLKKDKPNAILVGPAGSGKTAIVEGLAAKIALGNVPENLKQTKILLITTSDFTADAMFVGQFEARVKQFINDVESDKNTIIFIDESHTIMGGGVHGNPNNLQNMLKPGLARGTIRMIGCTTDSEVEIMEKDKAFMRRFEKVIVSEPLGDSLKKIIKAKLQGYEEHHKCRYTEEAIDEAIRLTQDLPGSYPDKTLAILDHIGSKHQISGIPTINAQEIRDILNETI